jgi:hypothetical protein
LVVKRLGIQEQALSPAERCPALSVDPKPLGVLDIRDGKMSGEAAIQSSA